MTDQSAVMLLVSCALWLGGIGWWTLWVTKP